MAETVRPLSSFSPVEQRAILALVEAADIRAAQVAEIREATRAAAYEATIRALRDHRVAPPARQASPQPLR